MFRRRRLVRLHLNDNQPSIEGILVGSPFGWADHYVLRTANVLADVDKTEELDGIDARVPRERVVFVQTLS
jgi:hypothetical protein